MVDDDQGAWARALRNYHQATQGHGIVALGMVAAAVFPILGVMIGIVLLFRARVVPGLVCILLGVLAGTVYYLLEQASAIAGASTRSSGRAAAPPIGVTSASHAPLHLPESELEQPAGTHLA